MIVRTNLRKAVPTMSDKVSNLTEATFDEVISGSAEPVVVDFWAEWCGPCKMVAPILDEIAEEQDGVVKVTKLNVDENPSVAQRFGVMSNVVADKRGDEVVAVIVAGLQAQLERVIIGLACRLEKIRFQLFGEEIVGVALVDEDCQALTGTGNQRRRIVVGPSRPVVAEIAAKGFFPPGAVHRRTNRRKGRDRPELSGIA